MQRRGGFARLLAVALDVLQILGPARIVRQDRARLDALLSERAVNLQERSAAWQKSGWTDFDAASPPLSPEDIGRERELYGTGVRR